MDPPWTYRDDRSGGRLGVGMVPAAFTSLTPFCAPLPALRLGLRRHRPPSSAPGRLPPRPRRYPQPIPSFRAGHVRAVRRVGVATATSSIRRALIDRRQAHRSGPYFGMGLIDNRGLTSPEPVSPDHLAMPPGPSRSSRCRHRSLQALRDRQSDRLEAPRSQAGGSPSWCISRSAASPRLARRTAALFSMADGAGSCCVKAGRYTTCLSPLPGVTQWRLRQSVAQPCPLRSRSVMRPATTAFTFEGAAPVQSRSSKAFLLPSAGVAIVVGSFTIFKHA